jgi:hypothetical protein
MTGIRIYGQQILHEMTTILFSTKHESLEVKCQNISQRENLAELFERSSWNHLGR